MNGLLDTGLMAIFFFVIPVAIVYFRYKKKIKTGFAAGLLLTSFLLGLISSVSFNEDPVERFERLINLKNRQEAKKALMIVIQYGPEYVSRIDPEKIIEKDIFNDLKLELIREYEGIASGYYRTYTVADDDNCTDFLKKRNTLGYLKHAAKLLEYSESIGGGNNELKRMLDEKIQKGSAIVSRLEEQCR